MVSTHGTLPKELDVKVTKEEPKDVDSKFSPWEISIKQKLSQSFNLREKFWKLDPYLNAPQMPFGYLTTLLICLIPPLWNFIMTPKLNDWDQNYSL